MASHLYTSSWTLGRQQSTVFTPTVDPTSTWMNTVEGTLPLTTLPASLKTSPGLSSPSVTAIGVTQSTMRSSSPINTSPLDTGSSQSLPVQSTGPGVSATSASAANQSGNNPNAGGIIIAAILGVTFSSLLIFLCVFFRLRILVRRRRVQKFRTPVESIRDSSGDMVFAETSPVRMAAERGGESGQSPVGLRGGDSIRSSDLHGLSQHPSAIAGQQLRDPFADPSDRIADEQAERSSSPAPRWSSNSTISTTVSFSRPPSGDNVWLSLTPDTKFKIARNPHVGSTGHYTPRPTGNPSPSLGHAGDAYTQNLTSWSKSLLETLNIPPSRRDM